MEYPFLPLLLGGDINVYSMARAFHEAYGVTSVCYGKYAASPAAGSAIIDYRACPTIETEQGLWEKLSEVMGEYPEKTLLLIPCGDSYVRLVAQCRDRLPDACRTAVAPIEQIDRLNHKEHFYALCERMGLPYPKTLIHRREMGWDFPLPFDPPYILKPANGVAYWAHPFQGNDKVFRCDSRETLVATLGKVYASGYDDSMIIQEFIPGDDSHMRVLTAYSDQTGKVRRMCLGHVILEEHGPHALGNHAVILTEQQPELCERLRGFLEETGYVGFSNFDLKYDARDGSYRLFEMNCRQGRSNYYVTASGGNLARLLVEDLWEQKPCDFACVEGENLWLAVPRGVAFTYGNPAYRKEMRRLIQEGKWGNPLFYERDRGLFRRIRMERLMARHFGQYRRYLGKPDPQKGEK